jgi:hypothetical protein
MRAETEILKQLSEESLEIVSVFIETSRKFIIIICACTKRTDLILRALKKYSYGDSIYFETIDFL